MKKAIFTFLIGSLALVPVYEMEGSKVLTNKNEQVEATLKVDENNRVTGYVEDADKTKFFSGKQKVKGEWKSDGTVEVRDKYGYKYNLKPTGSKMIGERRTNNYDYRIRRQKNK